MTAVALLPYADFLGISIVGARDGAPLLVMPYADGLEGGAGHVHGGALAGLLEIAATAAIDATADGGDARAMFKPVTVTVDFMRPAIAGQPCHACGRVVRIGQRIANVDVTAWQDDPDRPIAVARMTVAIGETPTR